MKILKPRVKLLSNILCSFLISILLVGCDFTSPLHKKILKAQELVSDRKYEEAVNHFEKILDDSPPQDLKIKVYYRLGELNSVHLNRNKKAIEYFERIKKETNDPNIQVNAEERCAEIYFNFLKDWPKSILGFKRLMNFTPQLSKFDEYQYKLAISFYKNSQFVEAEKLFNEIKANPAHRFYAKAFYYQGLMKFEREDWTGAIEVWNQYINVENRKDSIVQTKFLIANAYETMEDLKSAYEHYYSILGEYPNTEVVQNRLNAIYDRRIARKR